MASFNSWLRSEAAGGDMRVYAYPVETSCHEMARLCIFSSDVVFFN